MGEEDLEVREQYLQLVELLQLMLAVEEEVVILVDQVMEDQYHQDQHHQQVVVEMVGDSLLEYLLVHQTQVVAVAELTMEQVVPVVLVLSLFAIK